MLQIDHVYDFLYQELFKDFDFYCLPNGTIKTTEVNVNDICIFTQGPFTTKKIFFYDQEPLISPFYNNYLDVFNWVDNQTTDQLLAYHQNKTLPYNFQVMPIELLKKLNNDHIYKTPTIVTSEISSAVSAEQSMYYFFHGFAALDWYRGYYALNYSKPIVKPYTYDFVSYNRIINNDRSYRIYWISRLVELGLLEHGQVSFNVTDNPLDDWRDEVVDPNTKLSEHAILHAERHLSNINKLVIDQAELPGSASADIPRSVDALWNIVTETVFYYDKLHLTEKIFKPIVSKQPFMLLAAPGNLAYLRRYGFKTFDGIIDESYDSIQDNDQRIDAVAKQLHWYCNLRVEEKQKIVNQLAPIVEYNFHHFYGEFKHIITTELLTNTKQLFKKIGYDDKNIAYDDIYKVLTR